MLLGTMLVLLLFGGAGPAQAHAALRSADPEDGTVLKSAPGHITLTFTESVGLLDDSFRVLSPKNERVRTGEAEHVPGRSDTARVSLPASGLGEGTFTVAWRVVSADSHPVSGAFTFSIGEPSATTAAVDPGPVENPATTSLYNIARYLAYLAAALLIGTAVFLAYCRPADPDILPRLLRAGWWTLLGATVALFVLRAPYEAGTGPTTAFDAAAFERTVTSRPGVVLLARLALLGLTAVFLLRLGKVRGAVGSGAGGAADAADSGFGGGGGALAVGSRTSTSGTALPGTALPVGSRAVGTVLALGLALTWAAGEHASAGIQVPVAMASSVLHVLAMAAWLGGLAALVVTLYRAAVVEPETVTRFSRLAFVSVVVLVVTGVYQSWRGLGSWSALTDTSYGRLLVAKLIAVVVLLTAAGFSRLWTVRMATEGARTGVREEERVPEAVGGPALPAPPHKEPDEGADRGPDREPGDEPAPVPDRRGLRRSVLAEVTVGVVVLVVTTVLTGTVPGRAEAEAAQSPATAGLPAASVSYVPFEVGGARGKVQITLDPGRVGRNSVEAVVLGADGGFAIVPELRLSFTLPAQDIGPLDAGLTDKGGYWGTGDLDLPIAGTWEMKVTVRVSEIDQVSETKSVVIG
ncbi:copper resistance protein CopC [Streptomyces sp. S.PB5]|uniref:copper resistance CopC/CopD family protein n=1 Tax=Streptomyces sp. S.PB5 TaxID=3020844 RepID=UPI0025AFFB49|nr:copper resistance protein CopC [Streptomyces sp. S.PB5]MDN3023870.1 copper resistance protein CopC [Streptomyces sp. S.PB5]